MPSLKSSLLAAAVFAAYVNQAFAAPTSPSISTQLFARHVTNINNCDQHQRDTINLALGEMRRLALKAQTITVDNNAYKHYFLDSYYEVTPGDPDTEEVRSIDVVRKLYSLIGQNNVDTNAPYSFTIDCADIDKCHPEDSDGEVFAVTDASAGDNEKVMTLCPAFFDSTELERRLPYDEDNDEPYCNTGNEPGERGTPDYTNFLTRGHVLVHELTHVDALAKIARIPEVDETHATSDVGKIQHEDFGKAAALWLARKIKDDCQRGQTCGEKDEDLEGFEIYPMRNGESYAGLATELYFQAFCKTPFIPPETGAGDQV